jgi:hypothetical protein
VIFTGAATVDHFAANPCESDDAYRTVTGIFLNLLFVPYTGVILVMLIIAAIPSEDGTFAGFLFVVTLGPFLILLGSFIYAVIKQRHLLAQQCRAQNNRWKIWVVWYRVFH